MWAICRNCRLKYDTELVNTMTEGYCTNQCAEKKARRLGWQLRSGMNSWEFLSILHFKKIGHRIPNLPSGIETRGIIPLRGDDSKKEKIPFRGQISFDSSRDDIKEWVKQWISKPREIKECEDKTVIILCRDDYRFIEAKVHLKRIRNDKHKDKIPKKVSKPIHVGRRTPNTKSNSRKNR